MSDLISIGKSGVTAYRNALSAVGENVVNAETKGYARRQVNLSESPASAGNSAVYRASVNFGGVDTASVARAWDDFKAADSRLSSADAGRSDARVRWLTTTESALDDSDNGVGTRLTEVFNAVDTLASDPNGELPRRTVLLAIDDASGAIRTSATALARTGEGIRGEARTTVDSINASLTQLAKLNVEIRRAGDGTSTQAQYLDNRDRLIDDIASKLGIDATIAPDGTATIRLAGTSGATLLSSANPSLVGLTEALDGRLSLTVSRDGTTSAAFPFGGSLAGLIDVAGNVADHRAQLDSLAADFAQSVNGWQAQGLDANGAAGGPLLSITGSSAATLNSVTSDPDAVAAASTTGVANGNALTFSALRTGTGVEARWSAMVAGQSQILSSAKSEATAAASRRDASFAARDAGTGIDLDREAADLMRFQQAYAGSARIIQVARETMQSILSLF